MEIGFSYGVLCDGLEKQANKQGFTFGDDIEFVESLRKAFNTGRFYFLTDKQSEMALKKVHKQVTKLLKPLNSKEEC